MSRKNKRNQIKESEISIDLISRKMYRKKGVCENTSVDLTDAEYRHYYHNKNCLSFETAFKNILHGKANPKATSNDLRAKLTELARIRVEEHQARKEEEARIREEELKPTCMEILEHPNVVEKETQPERDRKLFISNLFCKTSEEDIFEYFSLYGNVHQCYISRDRKTRESRGFGYVVFQDSKSVRKVLEENSHEIYYTDVTVHTPKQNESEPEELCKVYVGNLHIRATERDLLQYFSKYGKVIDCYVVREFDSYKSRGFGFVIYSHSDMVYNTLAAKPHILKGIEVNVEICYKKQEPVYLRQIKVSYLSTYTTEEKLYDYFKKYGQIECCYVMRERKTRKSRCFGYLIFENASTVKEIPLTTSHLIDNRSLVLELPKKEKFEIEGPRKLYIDKLSPELMEDTIIYYFEKYGPVQSCVIKREKTTRISEGYGFVIFETEKDTKRAEKNGPHEIDYCEISCFTKKGKQHQRSQNSKNSLEKNISKKAYPNKYQGCRVKTTHSVGKKLPTNAVKDPFLNSMSKIEIPNPRISINARVEMNGNHLESFGTTFKEPNDNLGYQNEQCSTIPLSEEFWDLHLLD